MLEIFQYDSHHDAACRVLEPYLEEKRSTDECSEHRRRVKLQKKNKQKNRENGKTR